LSQVDQERTWRAKFADAIRGINFARSDKSFVVHQLLTVTAIAAGIVFQIDRTEWCLVVLCVSTVVATETINGSIESLAKFSSTEHDPQIGRCLDMAAGAVLLTAIGAACVGLIIFIPKIIAFFTKQAESIAQLF
jgi:diacylglycerol kinase